MKIANLFLLILIVSIVSGCSIFSSNSDTSGGTLKKPPHAGRVEILRYDDIERPISQTLDIYDLNLPERPYKIVALLTCAGNYREEVVMRRAILYQAKLLGADGVLNADIIVVVEGDSERKQINSEKTGRFDGVYEARAFVYTDK